MTLSIFDAAKEAPDAAAFVVDGRVWTYAQAAEEVRKLEPPSVLVAKPDLASIFQLHAALAHGRRVVLHPARWTEAERERAVPPPQDAAAIVFTSGTTGEPKGIPIRREALLASASLSAENLPWRDDDRWLLNLSFAHIGGLSVLTRSLLARKPVVVGTGDVQRDLGSGRATCLSLVPSQLLRLGFAPPPFVRAVLLGGGPTPERARHLGWPILETYGLTEACSQVATQAEAGGPLRPLIDVRIGDGVIEVRGPTVFERGWYATGDWGRLDERGGLVVLGRRDDVIVTGGEKVHPREIEAALERCPGVAGACAFGVPSEAWGAVVRAIVVPNGTVTEDALFEALGGELAPYKRPRRIDFVPELPLSPNGKIDRGRARRDSLSRADPR